MNRILIIDDNHSLIDTIQVMLKDLGLLFDSASRYADAERLIFEVGAYLNNPEINKILDFQKKMYNESNARKKEANSEIPLIEKPNITSPFVKEDGFMLILVEQNTESSIKGIDFIDSITKSNSNFTFSDFLLMAGNISEIEDRAIKMNLPIMEKPVRAQQLKNFVQNRLNQINEKFENCEKAIEEYDLVRQITDTVNEPAPETPTAKVKKAPKRATAKKSAPKPKRAPASKTTAKKKTRPKTKKSTTKAKSKKTNPANSSSKK